MISKPSIHESSNLFFQGKKITPVETPPTEKNSKAKPRRYQIVVHCPESTELDESKGHTLREEHQATEKKLVVQPCNSTSNLLSLSQTQYNFQSTQKPLPRI